MTVEMEEGAATSQTGVWAQIDALGWLQIPNDVMTAVGIAGR